MVLRPPDPPLRDELVELRPWLFRDVPAIVAACNDPETARWTTVPSPYSEEDARAWISRCKTAWADGAAPLAVIERASGEVAAAITLWLHARTGEMLWKGSVGGQVSAGPMSYAVAGKQYVAIAAGSALFVYGLRQ